MNESEWQDQELQDSLLVKNGVEVRIRPIRPSDSELEWEFVHHLSPQSKHFRFMAPLPDLTPDMVRHFTVIDFSRDMALVAIIHRPEKDEEIAVGRFFKYPDWPGCEFALAVLDPWQGCGIGHRIMQMLIQDATRKGYRVMEGRIMRTNTKMIQLVERLGFSVRTDEDDPQLTIATLALNRNRT